MFWSTAVCRPVRDIEVLRDLQVHIILVIIMVVVIAIIIINIDIDYCHYHKVNTETFAAITFITGAPLAPPPDNSYHHHRHHHYPHDYSGQLRTAQCPGALSVSGERLPRVRR